MNLEEIKELLNNQKGRRDELRSSLEEYKTELRVAERDESEIIQSIKVMSYISQNNQESIINMFENILSAGLKDLFDDSYNFRFDIKTRGDSSACDFELKHSVFPGWTDLVFCNGKSVQEIIAVIFRIVLIYLSKTNRRVIILDEPLSGVEGDRQRQASKFLSEICKKFQIQLIVITHNQEFIEFSNKQIDISQPVIKPSVTQVQ